MALYLHKKVLQPVHTLQIQAVDGLESFQVQSGSISLNDQRIKMAWEREAETNNSSWIKGHIILLSSFGNL